MIWINWQHVYMTIIEPQIRYTNDNQKESPRIYEYALNYQCIKLIGYEKFYEINETTEKSPIFLFLQSI